MCNPSSQSYGFFIVGDFLKFLFCPNKDSLLIRFGQMPQNKSCHVLISIGDLVNPIPAKSLCKYLYYMFISIDMYICMHHSILYLNEFLCISDYWCIVYGSFAYEPGELCSNDLIECHVEQYWVGIYNI